MSSTHPSIHITAKFRLIYITIFLGDDNVTLGEHYFELQLQKNEQDQAFTFHSENNASCAFCFTRVQMCVSEVCKDWKGIDEYMNEWNTLLLK